MSSSEARAATRKRRLPSPAHPSPQSPRRRHPLPRRPRLARTGARSEALPSPSMASEAALGLAQPRAGRRSAKRARLYDLSATGWRHPGASAWDFFSVFATRAGAAATRLGELRLLLLLGKARQCKCLKREDCDVWSYPAYGAKTPRVRCQNTPRTVPTTYPTLSACDSSFETSSRASSPRPAPRCVPAVPASAFLLRPSSSRR